jgi:hypothetical protein
MLLPSTFVLRLLIALLGLWGGIAGLARAQGGWKESSRFQARETTPDCRLQKADMQPLISDENPYFFAHYWDNNDKVEHAFLSRGREVFIEQSGCKRHHRLMKLHVAPRHAEPQDLNFYATELFNLMNRVYYDDSRYWKYKQQFEEALIDRLPEHGLDQPFNFQIAEFTFICHVWPTEQGGAKMKLKMVELIHASKIKLPGIPGYKDDGWFQPARR